MALRAFVGSTVLCAAALAAGLIGVAQTVRAAEQGPFAGLSGSWSGEGSVTMSNGSHERIRCRATYSMTPADRSLNQGLRCASDSWTPPRTSRFRPECDSVGVASWRQGDAGPGWVLRH